MRIFRLLMLAAALAGGSCEVSPIGMPDRAGLLEYTDAEIAAMVRDAFARDPALAGAEIRVDAADRDVTLTGRTASLPLAQRAETLARSVPGVRVVRSLLQPDPEVVPDDDLRARVEAALLANPATDGAEIAVEVEDGRVRLSGIVDSQPERRLAGEVAGSVEGVRALDNGIGVARVEGRSDAEIAADVREAIRWDAVLNGRAVDVEVENGRVVLRGAVGRPVEKFHAESAAWVAGVSEVDASGLEVRPGRRRTVRAAPGDEELRRAVERAVAAEPLLRGARPEVEVRDGRVTLGGEAPTLRARERAVEIALGVAGVDRVVNRMGLRRVPMDDAALAGRVEAALERDAQVGDGEVRVRAFGGAVHLYGTVRSEAQRARAAALASQTPGVREVRNHLTTDPAPPAE